MRRVDLAAVDRDLAGAGLTAWFGILDLATQTWVYTSTGFHSDADVAGFGDRGLVIVVGRSVRRIAEDGDLSGADAAEVAAYLQDTVIEQLWAGWPEIRQPDGRTRLLHPLRVDGHLWWADDTEPVCRVGELDQMLPRATDA